MLSSGTVYDKRYGELFHFISSLMPYLVRARASKLLSIGELINPLLGFLFLREVKVVDTSSLYKVSTFGVVYGLLISAMEEIKLK